MKTPLWVPRVSTRGKSPILPLKKEKYDRDKNNNIILMRSTFSIDKLVFLVILSVFSITISAYRDARWGY